jgi:WhiB family redox-sensing transcriptional regulator
MSIIAEVLMPPEWTRKALCAEVDPEIFFPDKGERTAHVKQICKACIVKVECLEYSIQNNERFGVWGGLTEHDRRKVRARKKVS